MRRSLEGLQLSAYSRILGIPASIKKNRDIIPLMRRIPHRCVEVPLKRIKVMVIGSERGNKTALVNCLLGQRPDSSFHGGALPEFTRSGIQFQVWNFPDEQIRYNTHTFLFERRCIYVIACSHDDWDLGRALEQLIQSVRSRARNAPVIVVSTRYQTAERTSTGAFEALKAKYPSLLRYHAIHLTDRTCVSALINTLVLSAKNEAHIYQSYPIKYRVVHQALMSLRGSELSLDRGAFQNVVQAAELPAEHYPCVLEMLHRAGIVYELPGGDVVLQPQQLIGAMLNVIQHRAPGHSGTQNPPYLGPSGHLLHSDLPSIWPNYTPSVRLQLLQLMHITEIAFPLYDSEDNNLECSLIPSMLCPAYSTVKLVEIRCFPDCEDCRADYGRIFLRLRYWEASFFPKLQARLRIMAVLGETWKQYMLVACSDHLSTALISETEEEICVLFPVKSDNACRIVVRAVQLLIEDQYSSTEVADVRLEVGDHVVVTRATLVQGLAQRRDAAIVFSDSAGKDARVPYLLVLPLLPEFREDPTDFASLTEDERIIAALNRAVERCSNAPDNESCFANLSILLCKAIPFVLGCCGITDPRVRVLWLCERERRTGVSRLVPICPGYSAASRWSTCDSASIENFVFGSRQVPEGVKTTVFAALRQLGVRQHESGGEHKWSGLVEMSPYTEMLLSQQDLHFSRRAIAEGIEAYLHNVRLPRSMPTMAGLRQRTNGSFRSADGSAGCYPLLMVAVDAHPMRTYQWMSRPRSEKLLVFCICSVCGRKGASGRNGRGYELYFRTKSDDGPIQAVEKVALKAIAQMAKLRTQSLEHLQELSGYTPRLSTLSAWGQEKLCERTKIEVRRAMTDANLQRADPRYPVSTTESAFAAGIKYRKDMSDVLVKVDNPFNPQYTGLVEVFCEGHGTWVCDPSKRTHCKAMYEQERSSCLRLQY